MKPKVYESQSTSLDSNPENSAIHKKHSMDNFERCYDMFDEGWRSRYHYLLMSILMSNGNNRNLHMLKLEVELSGGIFMLLYMIVSFLFSMPLIYTEIFLGKYTKLTNCQMYRMATVFFGFSLAIFLTNIAYQIIEIPDDSIVIANAIKTFLNFNGTKHCVDTNKECYSYLDHGPINETCVPVFMGMQCETKGFIRFPKQYMFWKLYMDDNDKHYPYSQLIAGLVLTWGVILYISMKELETLGAIMNTAFLFKFITMTIVLILGLVSLQSADCIRALIRIDPGVFSVHNVINAVWYIIGHFGFVCPYGYMTIYAYVHFKANLAFESFFILFFNLLLTIYYFIVYYIAAGVIAGNLGVAVENTIVPEGGLFLIVIPELFDHLELPNTFLLIYYSAIWFSGTIKNAISLHLLLLNWYDYYPRMKYFSAYVTVVVCTFLCLLSIPICAKKLTMSILPLLSSIYLRIILELCITVTSTTVYFVYGVSRLCDDIEFTTGQRPVQYWRVMWNIIPIFGWISIFFSGKDVVSFTIGIDWSKQKTMSSEEYARITYFAFLTIVVISMILKIILHLNTPKLYLKLIKPQYYWGPPERSIRIERKNYSTNKQTQSERVYAQKIGLLGPSNIKSIHHLIEESFEEYFN